ncbi:MAG: Flp pilus assembly complex ATPase component TadA [Sedimentisphaerales bacterium]|nr:Flp pilus assembly complex ATPase component TadA [Sedimentisphaerales bacterium]
MPELLAAIGYGGYISPIKFVIFLILFFGWLPVIKWVYRDAEILETRQTYWTSIVFGAWAAAGLIWLLFPVFIIGLAIYLIAAGAGTISYVMHRNTLVPDFQRVLTIGHFKGLFSNEDKKVETLKSFVFITTNNNEVPVPEPKTPDFFGYKAAYDFFKDAIYRRAYDVICTPAGENYSVAYYIDGAAIRQPDMPKDKMDYLLRFVKHLANLDVEEKRKPQKGKFTIFHTNKRLDWEINTAGSNVGEQLRMKWLTQQNINKPADLGLTAHQLEAVSTLYTSKKGAFIISGPRKSGVTTTFYTLLKTHDAFLNSITTLEKQPSGKLQNIVQNIYALSDSGVTTYGKKLQSLIRTDPDIIGVADCEDAETAQVAAAAALSGKLVYAAFEEENVLRAIAKWIKLVGDKNKAIDSLVGLSNQRILRILCDKCKQAYEPNKDLLHKFNIPAEKAKVFYKTGKVIYDKRGKASPCENCQQTGYFGRMCIFECIIFNEPLRKAIKDAKSIADIGNELRRAKMLYLQEQALLKVIAGTTSINEMVRVLSKSKEHIRTADDSAAM